MEITATSWREDDKFWYFNTPDGEIKLEKDCHDIWLADIHYSGLDYSANEEVTIETTMRYQ